MSTNRDGYINNLDNKTLALYLALGCFINKDNELDIDSKLDETFETRKILYKKADNIEQWLSQEAPKESIYHKSDLKHKPILNGIPVNIVEDKTWYIHRTSEKRNCELYVFIIANCCLSTNETSGDKFKRSYFTKSDAIAIRDILNKKREGKRYLWVVSNNEQV